MKKTLSAMLIIISFLMLSGCAYKDSTSSYVEKTDFLLDTVVTIRLYDGTEDQLDQCMELVKKYNDMFSNHQINSDVTFINDSVPKPIAVHNETVELIQKAVLYSRLSNGNFDATIGSVSNLWDFHSEYPKLPDPKEIGDALKTVDYSQIRIYENTIGLENKAGKSSHFHTNLDLGAIAKGYISDRIRDYLISEGVTSASISLGGNVYIMGKKPDGEMFTVGIQKPFAEDGTAACTVQVSDKCVVTSGVYQRYFEKDGKIYHHILDPNTGYPIENDLYSVTVICDDAVDGDAFSTMLFTMGLEKALNYVKATPSIEAIFITNDGRVIPSTNISQYNFTKM